MRERTRAQLDPVGSSENRTLWVLAAAGTGVYAIIMTIAHWANTNNHTLAVVGAALTVTAAALAIRWTAPRRDGFTARRHLSIHIIALAGMAATLSAQHPHSFEFGDAYTAFIIAGLIVTMSPYRPPTELIAVGTASAIIAGLLLLIRVTASNPDLPPFVVVLTAIAPIVVLTAAFASYTDTILRAIEETSRTQGDTTEADTGTALDRVTVMTNDAIPLLQRILNTNTITRADRTAASRTSDTLRATLVAEINRTWLDASQHDHTRPHFTINDPTGLARELTPTRRTVLRALLGALANEPGFTGGNITLTQHTERNHLTIEAAYNATEYTTPPGHPVVSALLDLMRSVFTEIESSRAQYRVLVTFGYEKD